MKRVLGLITALFVAAMAAAQKPNIVFIYADDLGYGDTGIYGAKAVLTPNVDKLARGGRRFTSAYASSSTCTPSRFSLMTGSYAFRQKGTGVLPGNAALIVPTDHATLPSMLKKAGYATGIVGKWHLGLGSASAEQDWNHVVSPGPRQVGFDYSFIMAATGDRVPCVYLENQKVVGLDPGDPIRVSYKAPFPGEKTCADEYDHLKMKPSDGHNNAVVNGIPRIGYSIGGEKAQWIDEDRADIFTNKGVQFIEQNRSHPFFLYFATHDIHVPRVPHARFVGKTDMGPRGDAIAEFDWSVGEILATLDRLNLTKNTLVILTSDNGPVLDDGYQDEAFERIGDHKPSGIYRGGKYSIFEAGTRMPTLVSWPGHVKSGVSDALICQTDFLASFAHLVGEPLGAHDGVDSVNVMDALLGQTDSARQSLVEYGGSLAIRDGRWKYIQPSKRAAYDKETRIELGNSREPQLYDLQADPGETHNVANEHLDVVIRLSDELDRIRESGR
ncbi:MAG: arylsulfatase [Armatimonadetes bacterium]|nr:arylsulfatase [Armatimonadota bacterium]